MNKILLSCSGVPASAAEGAARDITMEFREHRPWYLNVNCTWDGVRLLLTAENDNDDDGVGLLDEFSDCLSAYIAEPFEGQIVVESISRSHSA